MLCTTSERLACSAEEDEDDEGSAADGEAGEEGETNGKERELDADGGDRE